MSVQIAMFLYAFLPEIASSCDSATEQAYAGAGLKVSPEVVSEAIDEKEVAQEYRKVRATTFS
ncbi:hypothetical protein [Microbulbifer sp. VAAF005]|uniref:hypothetical protein n=1 Tax=Microbulbifer sp. VAAF005 TaxID=3034230 RepID=UPI0024AD48EB|nr:hypothetical protein [Microbulbifer sp. VAAF005]WHI47606.1 hypothetical protein P0078_04240 [Microbulbifer sp. VAAF005]